MNKLPFNRKKFTYSSGISFALFLMRTSPVQSCLFNALSPLAPLVSRLLLPERTKNHADGVN